MFINPFVTRPKITKKFQAISKRLRVMKVALIWVETICNRFLKTKKDSRKSGNKRVEFFDNLNVLLFLDNLPLLLSKAYLMWDDLLLGLPSWNLMVVDSYPKWWAGLRPNYSSYNIFRRKSISLLRRPVLESFSYSNLHLITFLL